MVCYSYKCLDEGSADALASEEAVLNLLYNVFGLEGKAGQIADRGFDEISMAIIFRFQGYSNLARF